MKKIMRLHWLLPTIYGIPVLMYHRVWPGINDDLTIDPDRLRSQWQYLKEQGYNAVSLTDFLSFAHIGNFPERSILLTFDDGYRNNMEYVYPMLKEFNWKATFFIIGDTVDGSGRADKKIINEKMNATELAALDPEIIQLGLHGYHHENFNELGIEEIKQAVLQSIQAFDTCGLPYHKVLAYPYGARPKDQAILKQLKAWFPTVGLQAAFRIGNQVARIPIPDIFEIKRIDIKGTDTINDFRIKLKKGKLKPF